MNLDPSTIRQLTPSATNSDQTPRQFATDRSAIPDLVNAMVQSVLQRFWIILLCALSFGAVAFGLLVNQEPFYRASAAISIDPREVDGIDVLQAPTVLIADALVVDSEVEIIRSNSLLREIITSEPFWGIARKELTIDDEFPSDEQIEVHALKMVQEKLSVEREARTFVIRIRFEASTPELAANTANAIADAYVQNQVSNHLEQVAAAGEWISEQLSSIENDILGAETEIARFRLEQEIPQADAVGTLDQEIRDNDQRIVAKRGRIVSFEADISVATQALRQLDVSAEVDVLFLAETLRSSVLEGLGSRLNSDARNAQSDVSKLLLERVKEELTRIVAMRASAIEIAKNELKSSQDYAAFLQTERVEMTRKQAEINRKTRSLEALRTEDRRLRARFEATQRSEQFFVSPARVIDRAKPPLDASNPGKSITLMAAVFGGGIFGLALIYLLEQISDVMRRGTDVAATFNLPFLGMTTVLSRSELRRLKPLNPEIEHNASASQLNKFRVLSQAARHELSRNGQTMRRVLYEVERTSAGRAQTVAIVSPLRGDGKSFLASNLAFFASENNRRVLLVDADPAGRTLTNGLSILTNNSRSLGPSYQISPSLDFIPVTTVAITATALQNYLTSAEQADREYDLVVLDMPALGYVSSQTEFIELISCAVATFRWGKTSASVAQQIVHSVPELYAKIIGVCLSLAPPSRSRRFERIPDIEY